MTDIALLEQVFNELNIDCEKVSHPALFTAKEADNLPLKRRGTRLKNLFLRDNYGKRHFLLITTPDKQIDLKALAKTMQLSRLGFASQDRLATYLGVKPGCVSMLALLNDADNAVELWIDSETWQGELFHCHPFDNTQTWIVAKPDLLTFFEYTHHRFTLLHL
jgi:Ala-tRNA(Pro) deacylase